MGSADGSIRNCAVEDLLRSAHQDADFACWDQLIVPADKLTAQRRIYYDLYTLSKSCLLWLAALYRCQDLSLTWDCLKIEEKRLEYFTICTVRRVWISKWPDKMVCCPLLLQTSEESTYRRKRSQLFLIHTAEPEFLNFKEPRKRFQGINSASLCSLSGRYDNLFLFGS